MGIENDFIQHNHLLEQYVTNKEYSYICSEGHLGMDLVFDIRNVPKLTDTENDRIFKKYVLYLIERKALEISRHTLENNEILIDAIADQLITEDIIDDSYILCNSTNFLCIDD